MRSYLDPVTEGASSLVRCVCSFFSKAPAYQTVSSPSPVKKPQQAMEDTPLLDLPRPSQKQ